MNYDWDKWSDGAYHTLIFRQDFESIQGLRSAAHAQGKKRGGKYSIRQSQGLNTENLIIVFLGPKSEKQYAREKTQRRQYNEDYQEASRKARAQWDREQAGKNRQQAQQVSIEGINLDLLTKIIKLVHPDMHPPERRSLATEVTQALMPLRERLKNEGNG